MRYCIYGGGFALYGYLAALAKNKKNKILIEKKYIKFITKRFDLKRYIKQINFVHRHHIQKDDVIIYAKRPVDQFNFLKKKIKLFKKNFLFLEKPIAQNPKKALEIINLLQSNKIAFSLSYIFFYTKWFKMLNLLLVKKKVEEITLNWNFNSVNKKNNWKNKLSQGGGIISFYGIHILSILTFFNFRRCQKSIICKKKDQERKWNAKFLNSNSISFKININIRSKIEKFQLSYKLINKDNKQILLNAKNPFLEKKNKSIDLRVNILKKYIYDKKKIDVNKKSLILWRNTLKKTNYLNEK